MQWNWISADPANRCGLTPMSWSGFPSVANRRDKKTVVDTNKRQPPVRRSDSNTTDDDSVVGDVAQVVFDLLTNWN